MEDKNIKIGISATTGFIAIVHTVYPDFKIDNITLALITIAIIPWIAHLFKFKSLELPGGWKIEFQERIAELDKKVEQTEIQIARVKDMNISNYWSNLAETYLLQNKWKDAKYAYNKAIASSPDYISAYLGLAETYLSESKQVRIEEEKKYLLQEAFNKCELFISQKKDFGPAYMTRAAVRHALGQDLVDVRIDLQRAKDLNTELKIFIAEHDEFESLRDIEWFKEITK